MVILNFLLQANPVTDTIANAIANPANTEVSVTENISYLDFLLKGGIMIYPLIILLFSVFMSLSSGIYLSKMLLSKMSIW
ncbi:hypothetical protein ACFQZF_07930 [Flavobacterium myungsuense]|uniref:hypothetical protein n=1 Tax=Flavobacterium myungsuense TaxID=651823 RepID=UPI00362E4DF8